MKGHKSIFADVAVFLPLENQFTYRVPAELMDLVRPGVRVLVPLGRTAVTGCVTALKDEPGVKGVKDITDVLDPAPLFDDKRLRFYKWLSSYYFAPLGMVLSLINPSGAAVKSSRFLRATDKGAQAAGEAAGVAREILLSSAKGVSIASLVKRHRGKPVYATVERLKKEGLVEEEVRLKGGDKALIEKVLSLDDRANTEVNPLEKRGPLQARILGRIRERGDVPLGDIIKEMGGVWHAVRRLQALGLIHIKERRVFRDPVSGITPKASGHEPNEEQAYAIREIASALHKGGFSPFLLYGVTGSGKTLVYIKAIEEARKSGKGVLFLVPEIALTSWPVAYLMERFPGEVALYHSGLSEGERCDEWRRISDGRAMIVVGARSALFAPLGDMGLIIVDEEHEASYKQEEGVRYNGRDSALMLGKSLGITVVLGSATPSVESFHNARTEKLTPLYLRKRVLGGVLPHVEIEDRKGRKGEVISERLKAMMEEVLGKGQQAILFLNRRGFAGSLICRDCGHVFMCLNCSVSLTAHKREGVLKCHYCAFAIPLPGECPRCRSFRLAEPGAGTERVEEEVKALFPGVKTARMDRDTTSKKGSAMAIIDDFEGKRADVLIGTQMVSKGHHFPGVTLVGIISGDTSLNIPDFRSSERTFQLVTQASGRAGRGDEEGRVVIQTLNPEHYCFRNALGHDYEGFFEEEIKIREEALYPPFARLCLLRVESNSETGALKAAELLKSMADAILRRRKKDVCLLGPAPALLSRLKGRHRWQLLVKGGDVSGLHQFVALLKKAFEEKRPPGVTLTVDVDPAGIA